LTTTPPHLPPPPLGLDRILVVLPHTGDGTGSLVHWSNHRITGRTA
ncbi:hypothetical protein A2U01_0070796, partial [Trifolium medium]|nr:hypothetical protein [Trifolium medium]